MLLGVILHRQPVTVGITRGCAEAEEATIEFVWTCPAPARESAGHTDNIARGVSGSGREDLGPILVELMQPDSKQLHELTRKVFIRHTGTFRFLVAQGAQVVSHHWMERDCFQQVAVIAE